MASRRLLLGLGAASMAVGIGVYVWHVHNSKHKVSIPTMPPPLNRPRTMAKRMRKPAQHSDFDLTLNEQHRKQLPLEIAISKFLYSSASPADKSDRVDSLFDKSDNDNDGKVDKKELKSLLTTILEDFKVSSKLVTQDGRILDASVKDSFKTLDEDDSGPFDRKQFRDYAQSFLSNIMSPSTMSSQ